MKLSILILVSVFAISLMTSCNGTSPYANYQYLSAYNVSDAVAPLIKTADSIQIYTIAAGTGNAPQKYDSVVLNIVYEAFKPSYSTTFIISKTKTSATTSSFRLGIDTEIAGIQEAVTYMKQGGKARFIIPSKLAYGAEGSYPFADYLCDVELISVTNGSQPLFFNTTGKDTVKLSNGIKYIKCLEKSTATKADSGNYVTIKYTGYLTNGEVFDLSINGKFGFIAGTTGVIQGMNYAVEQMRVGERFRFILPYSLCYGSVSTGKIGSFSDLIFDIELVSATKTK